MSVLTLTPAGPQPTPQELAEARRIEYRERERTIEQACHALVGGITPHSGYQIARAICTHLPDATPRTADEVRALLVNGFTIKLSCYEPRNGTRGTRRGYASRKHRLTVNADGTINLLHHDDIAGDDVEAAWLIGALGGGLATCLVAQQVVVSGAPVPTFVHEGEQVINGKIRVLYTAMLWAQRHDADWPTVAPLLKSGVTPAVMDEWLADGWTIEQARPWWKRYLSREVANQWRATGQTGESAARNAENGETPNDDQRWLDAGLSRSAAQAWRRENLPPAQVAEWVRRGFSVSNFRVLRRLTRTRGVTERDAFAWADAGVPARQVMGWMDATQVDLDVALRWAPTGLDPSYFQTSIVAPTMPVMSGGRWTHVPVPGWTEPDPADVKVLVEAGVHGASLAEILRTGISASDFVAFRSLHPNGDRMSVRVLVEAIQAFRSTGSEYR